MVNHTCTNHYRQTTSITVATDNVIQARARPHQFNKIRFTETNDAYRYQDRSTTRTRDERYDSTMRTTGSGRALVSLCDRKISINDS